MMYTFYTNQVCPFCHRAAIALNEIFGSKVADLVKITPIDLNNMPEWYIKTVNPNAVVPTLQLTEEGGGEFMYESAIITEFLLEQHSSPLLPKEPLIKARQRQFISKFQDTIIPVFYKVLRSRGDEIEAAKKEALEALKDLEDILGKTAKDSGPFAFGDKFSFADLQTIPWLLRWVAIENYRKLKIPDEFTRVNKWISACKARDSVMKTSPPDSIVIEGYRSYAQ